ncbi:MAG: PKD domain-containing protein [Bacteroidia bacterium]|nr:PKD domain-containing protein [Bacteroidia bacterium]
MFLFNRTYQAVMVVVALVMLSIVGRAQPIAQFTVQGNTSGCAPLTVQFVNQSINAIAYFWDFGNGNTSTIENPVTVYLQPGSFTVKLVVTSQNGVKDSVIRLNYINTGMVPAVNFNATPAVVCEGETISFHNQSQYYSSCLWDFGDGNTSTDASPSHQYTLAGQFTVTLVAYNQQGGCSNSLTRQNFITIHPKPETDFSAPTTVVCDSNQPVIFTTASVNASAFVWDFGDGQTSTQQNPSHLYGVPGQFTVSLITTSSQGCKDTVVKVNYITLLDNPVPVITSTKNSGCTPVSIGFSTTAQNVNTYSWDFGSAGISNLAAPVIHYSSAGNYQTVLTVNYLNGCSNTSLPLSLSIYKTPIVSYNFTPASGCSPLSVSFITQNTGVGHSYLWDFGDGQTSAQQYPVHSYGGNGVFTTSLTVTSMYGCSSTLSLPNQVVVNNTDASFYVDVTSGCPPLKVLFTPNSTGSNVTYLWNFGDGQTSNLQSPTHLYQSSGSYIPSLTVTDGSGCTATYTLPSPVLVSQSGTTFITPPPVTACAPFTANFSDNSFGAVSWNWDFGDGSSSTLQSPTHTFFTPGSYTVSLNTQTAGIGCSQQIPVYRVFHIIGGEARFSFETEKCPPYIAYFHDSSVNAVSWFWDFGDGFTSTQQHPVHTYANPGTYTVSLTIITNDGCSYTATHNYAVYFEPLSANLIAFTTDTVLPLNVQFYANSQGATSWFWDFGDSITSTLQNPIHVFYTPPPYNISLTIANDSCSYTFIFPDVVLGTGSINLNNDSTIVHEPEPQTDCAPFSIHFYCPVLNTTDWLWIFGDGGISTLKNPVYTYTTPGLYDLTLVTTDLNGTIDTLFKPQFIRVNGVTGGFNMNASATCSGNSIAPVALTQNAASYLWDFGDGTTSALPSPQHSYANPANNYIVSLIVTDTSGCSAFAQQSFYGVAVNSIFSDKRKICAGDTVLFSTVNQNYASYLWDFGNGFTSTLPNPAFVFNNGGVFNVTLTITDTTFCQQTISLPYPIEVTRPEALFTTLSSNSNCQSVWYKFTNQSNNATSYLWNFGNGYLTNTANPTCYYNLNNPGNFTVTLTAFNNGCSSSYSMQNAVYIPYTDAGFTFTKSGDCIPVTVTFSDTSRDAISWFWDFGDGTFSTQQNPVHIYNSAPSAPVKLTITNQYGCTDTISTQLMNAAFAGVSMAKQTGCNPFQVNFSDSSANAVAWNWDFGNGQISNQQNPTVTYTQNGYYPIQLTITSVFGCTSSVIIDSAVHVTGPIASFNTTTTSSCAPALIDFQNTSLNAASYLWSFGDSSFSNSIQATHVYHTPGTYQVSLTATDSSGCTDSVSLNSGIVITGPVADFNIPGNSGCAPFEVDFSNQTINGIIYFWNFGDGDSSAAENPKHIYQSAGNYIVSLIAWDSTGCEDVFVYPDTIRVFDKPSVTVSSSALTGCTPLTVSFHAASTGTSNLLWNFGDGLTSHNPDPVHIYSDSGTYTVSLIALSNGVCDDTTLMTVLSYLSPHADFTADVTEGCAPLTVNFLNQSSGLIAGSYSWTFSDGQTSTQENPVMIFSQPGLYSVTLAVTNNGICTDSLVQIAYITVYDSIPPSAPQLLSASVKSDNEVTLTWMNVADADIWAYHLYRQNRLTAGWDLIYSVIDTNGVALNVINTFTDTGLVTLCENYSYRLQAEDRCGNRNPLDSLTIHTTMNISAFDQGSGIRVEWTPYSGCYFDEYELQRSEAGGGSWVEVAKLSSLITSYIDSSGLCPGIYNYRIKARSLCNSAYSAWSDTSASGTEGVGRQVVDIVFVTVMDDEYISLEWEPPLAFPDHVIGYELYRSSDKISYFRLTSLSNTELKYDDYAVDVHNQNYYYMIIPLNDCNVEPDTGYIGSSILLKSEMNPETESVKLKWTPYEQWQDGVKEYIIQRKDGEHPWDTIRTVGGSRTETED